MNIISNYAKDSKTKKKYSGSYEWWYFDAQSADGYIIVIIFYEGNPFSKRYIQEVKKGSKISADQFPAISISVYKKSKPIYYSFQEVKAEAAEFSTELPKGKVGKSRFEGRSQQSRLEYTVTLNQVLPSGDSIQGDLTFSTDIYSIPFSVEKNRETEAHIWNLVMPSCHVLGKLNISGYSDETINFNGLGYHDHNTGFEPLKDSFKEWYWGRYHFDESTLVYYLMNYQGNWKNRAWLISSRGEIETCDEVSTSSMGLTAYGLNSARVFETRIGTKKFYIQLDKILDSGPFYQRFGGRSIMSSDLGIKEARGISEYIKPGRIYSRLFWPLVDMRISYPDKIHWVQKNPKLYRWTW